eukprot:gb/GEZN01004453.1/.p1 GENE.gb/GEZN01004453.1/~~gb/GEZN01004453.1/.p1  ORF type:complete len:603 (-),score=55.76 gb/GEZN01004453.1/:158-1756(-)
MAWLLMADLALILNYGFHHTLSIIQNTFLDGVHCQISGFISLVCVLFSNVASTAVAFVTHRSLGLQARPFAEKVRKRYILLTMCMVLPGICYAALLSLTGQIGNYRGLYCCMKDNGNGWLVWTGFLIFATCGGLQGHYYYKSYHYVLEHINSSVGSGEMQKEKFVAGIRRHAFRMCGVFYLAWTPMMLGGFVSYFSGGLITRNGEAFPRWIDVIIVLCVKVVPLLDSLVVMRSVNKAAKRATPLDNLKSNIVGPAHDNMSQTSRTDKETPTVPYKEKDMTKDASDADDIKGVEELQITFKIDAEPDEGFVTSFASPHPEAVTEGDSSQDDSSRSDEPEILRGALNEGGVTKKNLPVLETAEPQSPSTTAHENGQFENFTNLSSLIGRASESALPISPGEENDTVEMLPDPSLAQGRLERGATQMEERRALQQYDDGPAGQRDDGPRASRRRSNMSLTPRTQQRILAERGPPAAERSLRTTPRTTPQAPQRTLSATFSPEPRVSIHRMPVKKENPKEPADEDEPEKDFRLSVY